MIRKWKIVYIDKMAGRLRSITVEAYSVSEVTRNLNAIMIYDESSVISINEEVGE